jgi:hypothetical protein
MAVRRRLGSAATILALAGTLASGCGGGGSNDGQVLFDGDASELVPHATGRSATFRVTATSNGASDTSSFTATVTGNEDGGVYVTRYVSATGAVAVSTSRDSGDEIRVERFVNDPGGPDEQIAVPMPPVGVVRTPVIAGEGFDGGFARTLELDVRIGDTIVHRQVLFTGSAQRIARERGTVTVPAGAFADAIRYAVHATGQSSIPVLGESLRVSVEVDGDEWFAPGAGGVKEELDVTVRAGDEELEIHFSTERTDAP